MCIKIIKYFTLIIAFLVFTECNSPDFDNTPHIEFISSSRDIMHQQSSDPTDSLKITFSFTDGDGDLGALDSLERYIYVSDLREPEVELSGFSFPAIPTEGASNGVSGNITIRFTPSCCIFEDNSACHPSEEQPFDTLNYEIYLKDRAGNESNRITTSNIILICD